MSDGSLHRSESTAHTRCTPSRSTILWPAWLRRRASASHYFCFLVGLALGLAALLANSVARLLQFFHSQRTRTMSSYTTCEHRRGKPTWPAPPQCAIVTAKQQSKQSRRLLGVRNSLASCLAAHRARLTCEMRMQ